MELILQVITPFSFLDKLLHNIEFIFRPSFDTPRIMKDKVTAGVGELIFNVVFSALRSHQKVQIRPGFGSAYLDRRVEDICSLPLKNFERREQLSQ